MEKRVHKIDMPHTNAKQHVPAQPPQNQKTSFFVELIKFAAIAFVIVIPFRMFIAQPFIVSGASMDPTFQNGDYLIVDELSYRFTEPERGDVVIFKYPKDPSKFFIKRVIGLPNETIHVNEGTVTVFNEDHENGIALYEGYLETLSYSVQNAPIELAGDEYFVLGDNRPFSSDSRSWGPLERDLIIGKAFLRLLPVSEVDVLPGAYESAQFFISE